MSNKNILRMLTITLCFMLVFAFSGCEEQPPETGGGIYGDFHYTFNDNEVTITGYKGSGGVVTIPNEIERKQVKYIGDNVFSLPNNITAITIPVNITSIGNNVFTGCTSLASITVDADNLNYVSQNGILYNKAKTIFRFIPIRISGSVTIPTSITSIDNQAFSGRTSLTSITIPVSVTSVGGRAFSGWTSSQTITVPWAQNSRPSGWDSSWNANCSAIIIYNGGE